MITEEQVKARVDPHIMQCSIDYSDALRLGAQFDAATMAEHAVSKDLYFSIARYFKDNMSHIVKHDDKGVVRARALVLTEYAFWHLINDLLEMAKDKAIEIMEENP
jgi:hypothetical protein